MMRCQRCNYDICMKCYRLLGSGKSQGFGGSEQKSDMRYMSEKLKKLAEKHPSATDADEDYSPIVVEHPNWNLQRLAQAKQPTKPQEVDSPHVFQWYHDKEEYGFEPFGHADQ